MTHYIKIKESYANAVDEGRKNFEVRLNDRGYNAGDEVVFTVVNKFDMTDLYHPLTKKKFKITYVHSGLGMQNDYVVFGIKECGTH